MGHEIDLSKYQIRTDLAIESIYSTQDAKIDSTQKKEEDITITDIQLTGKEAELIGKLPGHYITIEFTDITDFHKKEKVREVFSKYLKEILKDIGITSEKKGLVIGLGNKNSTPDALGPMTIDHIIVTSHLFELNEVEKGFSNIAAISPGVMGQTGIETAKIIKGLVKASQADYVIAVDALKSQAIDRVNRTIQMTDTGIHPGSGVGNSRKEISEKVLGVPVIAIGIPTVVDLVTVVSDTVGYMYQHFSYTKENINNPSHKLTAGNVNYLKKEVTVLEEDKVNLLGMLGHLTEEETKQLIFEVLTPIGYNLIVTPKEVDFVMEKLSDIIGNGINYAVHENVTELS